MQISFVRESAPLYVGSVFSDCMEQSWSVIKTRSSAWGVHLIEHLHHLWALSRSSKTSKPGPGKTAFAKPRTLCYIVWCAIQIFEFESSSEIACLKATGTLPELKACFQSRGFRSRAPGCSAAPWKRNRPAPGGQRFRIRWVKSTGMCSQSSAKSWCCKCLSWSMLNPTWIHRT